MCRSTKMNFMAEDVPVKEDNLNLYSMLSDSDGPIKVTVVIENKLFEMLLDTGSEFNVMSKLTYNQNFKNINLKHIDLLLKAYNGVQICPLGQFDIEVVYRNERKLINFAVIENGGPPLLGRNFLKVFKIEFADLNYTSNRCIDEQKILRKFDNLFDGDLGLFKKSKATLVLKEGTNPVFFRPRPLPLAIKGKVEAEIDKLVSIGVLEQVDYSEWGTPIVPILKKNGSIRICGDFKVTLNKFIHVEKYPLPRIEEIFSKLYGGEEFTKLDLSMAYQQIGLDQKSRKFTTISTSKGLFQFTRLIYGCPLHRRYSKKLWISYYPDWMEW